MSTSTGSERTGGFVFSEIFCDTLTSVPFLLFGNTTVRQSRPEGSSERSCAPLTCPVLVDIWFSSRTSTSWNCVIGPGVCSRLQSGSFVGPWKLHIVSALKQAPSSFHGLLQLLSLPSWGCPKTKERWVGLGVNSSEQTFAWKQGQMIDHGIFSSALLGRTAPSASVSEVLFWMNPHLLFPEMLYSWHFVCSGLWQVLWDRVSEAGHVQVCIVAEWEQCWVGSVWCPVETGVFALMSLSFELDPRGASIKSLHVNA